MRNLLKKIIKSNSGFSLVEAIVTIAILGIAIIPISIVFTRTIEKTVDTRRQLEANQIAQEYIEALKSSEMSQIATLMSEPGGVRTIPGGTNVTDLGLGVSPDNFDITLSYEISPALTSFADVGATDVAPGPVDAIVTIPGYKPADLDSNPATDPEMWVDVGGVISNLPTTSTGSSTTRTVFIEGKRVVTADPANTHNTIEIKYMEGSTVYGSTGPFLASENSIRFYMKGSTSGTPVSTEIVVNANLYDSSNNPTALNVYIYEDGSNTVNATTRIDRGLVRFSRNLVEVAQVAGRIIEIKVLVVNNISGETLATVKTTKFDE